MKRGSLHKRTSGRGTINCQHLLQALLKVSRMLLNALNGSFAGKALCSLNFIQVVYAG